VTVVTLQVETHMIVNKYVVDILYVTVPVTAAEIDLRAGTGN
jgi:hypothetical protein